MRPPRYFSGALASVLALACVSTSWAQSSVATDPVGFVTATVKGGGTVATPQLSLISPTLLQLVEWQGPVGTISGKTINVANTPWVAGQFGTAGQYFVEVASGENAGAWTDIESSTTSSLTTLDDLSSFASAGSTIRIRKHVTLSSFFGTTNSAGIKGGTSVITADEVIVYDATTQATYFYYDASDGAGPAGWYNTRVESAANVVIPPNAGVVIRRKDSAPISFLSFGAAKTGNTLVPINAGLNVVGNVAAKGLTLASSGLYTGSATTGLRGSNSPITADEVVIYGATGQTTYWYYDASDSAGPAGWYDYRYRPADAVIIAPGTSFVVTRKSPGTAFNWAVPSPASF